MSLILRWRQTVPGAMGTILIVVLTPGFNQALGLDDRRKMMLVQALSSQLAIERFDEWIVRGRPRAAKIELDPLRWTQSSRTWLINSVPLPTEICFGSPRSALSRSNTATTFRPVGLRPTSTQGLTRLKLATIVKHRNRRPSAS